MRRFFRFLLWAIGILAALILLAVLIINLRGIPSYEPHDPGLKVEVTPERVERGLKIAASLCIECHKADNDPSLSGREVKDIPSEFGRVFSRNITQHKEIGIGSWTDGQIAYLVRTGIGRDGRYYPPYMPKFPLMSDEDLASVIAFLRSAHPLVQPNTAEPQESQPSFLAKILCNTVMKPLPYPEKAILTPALEDSVRLGEYFVDGLFACFACHSADFKTVNDLEPKLSPGYLGGGNVLNDLEGHKLASANITPDMETGIGSWTEAEFLAFMKGAPGKNGPMRYPMIPYTNLTDQEIRAIYAYLRTVPPVKNKVNRSFQ